MGLTPEEWSAVWLSLTVASRAVLVSLPLAILAAVVLARGRFPGKPLLDALVHLPLVMPPVVVGWALLMLSAFWHQARTMVVRPLPEGLRARLPLVDRPVSLQAQPQ